jgi:hypothetical protein
MATGTSHALAAFARHVQRVLLGKQRQLAVELR